VYEKIYNQVQRNVRYGIKRMLYKWAMRVGEKNLSTILAGRRPANLSWKLADRLLYSKVRAAMGGRVDVYISGGAPLGRELGQWYARIGIRINEGYGLTETSPVIALNNPAAFKLGTVGKVLPNLEVHIAEDGEILVKGPSVFGGYWNMPAETANSFENGWFKTGDIGVIDSDGFLSITDRKKDLIKTSGGKFIAPQPIEGSLKANPLISEAAVIGDRRRFPAVVIAPAFAHLEDWAQQNGVKFTTRAELVAHPKVRALYDGIVADVNKHLAKFEQLKRSFVLPEEMSVENGTLTPTLKLRRRMVEERYCAEIESLYADPTTEPASVS
jgi:long-chain acyl-CoA synthetase